MTTPATEAMTEAGHAASAPGMPQLDITTFPNQIFWLAVSLVVIFFILTRVVMPRIEAVLAERQDTITNDLTLAEELKQKAVEAEKAYEQALAEARAEASRIVGETRAKIDQELKEAIAHADAEIAAKAAESEREIAAIRASARDAIHEVAQDVAAEIVRALGFKPDAKAIEQAIEHRMKG